MEMQTLACNNTWLDSNAHTFDYNGAQTITNGTSYDTTGMWWNGYPYYTVVSSPARPIKLKLSEIERLRKAARADKSLKAILAKFTDQIEIEVDFE